MGTTPEQELQWAEQDYRIADDNLAAAQRRLDEAAEQFNDALNALGAAREACSKRTN